MENIKKEYEKLTPSERLRFLKEVLETEQITLFGIPIYPTGLRKLRRGLSLKGISPHNLLNGGD